MIPTSLGYQQMQDVSEHPLWSHPTIGLEALLSRASEDSRRILTLAAALAARRWVEETEVIARTVDVCQARWFDGSPRTIAFGALKAEPAVTSSDVAVALLTAVPAAPRSPGAGVPLQPGRWEEHRRRAMAAAARVTPEANPRRELAAPWSYGWSTWCHLYPNEPITRDHLFASLDDVAMSVFCTCAADGENFTTEELCRRERDGSAICRANFPPWVVPAVPIDDDSSTDAVRWTLRGWIARWPRHEYDLGTLLPLEAILAAGSVAWESPDDASPLCGDNTLRSAFARGTEQFGWTSEAKPVFAEPRPLAFREGLASWRLALRAIAGGKPVRPNSAALVEAVGMANLRVMMAFRDHLVSARSPRLAAAP